MNSSLKYRDNEVWRSKEHLKLQYSFLMLAIYFNDFVGKMLFYNHILQLITEQNRELHS